MNLRRCRFKDSSFKGYFHCWTHEAWVVEPSLMIGGTSGGQVSTTLGIVEYDDGYVAKIDPTKIIFEKEN